MKVIAKRLTVEILLSSLFVLLALVALFAFFDLIGQLDDVGSTKTINEALLMTVLTLPGRIYEVMPLAALLGGIYTMSRWATNSEFTVLRVAGLSPWRLASFIALPGLILVLATYFFGEVVSPPAQRYALEVKTLAKKQDAITPRGFSSGVWLRDVSNENDVKLTRFINVKYVRADNRRETGPWEMFVFNDDGVLKRQVTAESASYDHDRGWVLRQVVTRTYPEAAVKGSAAPVERQVLPEMDFKSSLGPNIFGVLTTRPDEMSMADLSRYIDHLRKNNQVTEQIEINFWQKAFYPLATFVMLALAMPFAYMNARSGGVALRIFFGVMIGILFYALNNVFAFLGVLTTWSPMVMTLIPTASMLVAAALAMYFVERR